MQIEKTLEEIQSNFIRRLKAYKGDRAEGIRLYAQLDFLVELNEAGLDGLMQELEDEYIEVIRTLEQFKGSGISANSLDELQMIMDLDETQILRSGSEFADRFKSKLMKGLMAGENVDQILDGLSIPNFKENWKITAINTAVDEFRQVATAKVFEDTPEQKFKLVGPADVVTRPECQAVLKYQPKDGWTIGEINKGAATKIAKKHYMEFSQKPLDDETLIYSWTFRGGFNCRHNWEPRSIKFNG